MRFLLCFLLVVTSTSFAQSDDNNAPDADNTVIPDKKVPANPDEKLLAKDIASGNATTSDNEKSEDDKSVNDVKKSEDDSLNDQPILTDDNPGTTEDKINSLRLLLYLGRLDPYEPLSCLGLSCSTI
eukprot:sb/3475433/